MIWIFIILGSIICKQANVANLILNSHTAAESILLVEEIV